jgi:hypothetical protein
VVSKGVNKGEIEIGHRPLGQLTTLLDALLEFLRTSKGGAKGSPVLSYLVLPLSNNRYVAGHSVAEDT